MSRPFNLLETQLNTSMLIEASAGTGKTYSLNHIVLRLLVEENIAIDRILLVTFTKSATAEMRARLRAVVLQTAEALQELSKSGLTYKEAAENSLFKSLDENIQKQYVRWINSGIPACDILTRLETASSAIEDAAIYTIHSFCQKMLKDYVFASQGSFETNVDDCSDLVIKAIDNVVREEVVKISNEDERIRFLSVSCKEKEKKGNRYKEFLLALSAMSCTLPLDKCVRLSDGVPTADSESGADSQKKDNCSDTPALKKGSSKSYGIADAAAAFAVRAPAELKRLKAEKNVMTYDDMLVDMEAQVLSNPEFRKAVSDSFDAVLIDEFQDTDPIQFNVFSTLFLNKSSDDNKEKKQIPLIFVGDPKQSIYGFRSADLNTYLNARDRVDEIYSLPRNFRSDPRLVETVNKIFSLSKPKSCFLNDKIEFDPVMSSKHGDIFELVTGKDGKPERRSLPPLTLWKYEETTDNLLRDEKNKLIVPCAEEIYSHEAKLIADDIVRLTSGSVFIKTKSEIRRVQPKDVCILVRRRSDAEHVERELLNRNIRYILKSSESVLASSEACEIKKVLEAIENPKDRNAMAKARATNIFGESLKDIEENTEAGLTAVLQIEEAGRNIEAHGIQTAFEKLFRLRNVEERILRTKHGDRTLTNYHHLLEILYEAGRRVKTVSGILRWLEESISSESGNEDYKLRLESDENLVRITTMHDSKGLEFPIVYLLKTTKGNKAQTKNVFKSEENGQKITWLNIGEEQLTEDKYPPSKLAVKQEECRILYVAVTRASYYLGIPFLMPRVQRTGKWYKPGYTNTLSCILTGQNEPEKGEIVLAALQKLKEQIEPLGCVVKEVPPEYAGDCSRPLSALADNLKCSSLAAAPAAHVTADWGRTSFTGMTQAIEEDKERPALDENEDEFSEDGSPAYAAPAPAKSALTDPFRYKDRATPAAAYGDFVHKLLESVRFDEPDPAEIKQTVASVFLRMDIKSSAPEGEEDLSEEELKARHIDALSVMVENVLSAKPLAALPDFELKTLSESEKASEMDFLLSNNVGEANSGKTLTARQLSDALEMLDSEKYGGLRLNERQSLTGYLSGSIDLAFAAGGKFWIIDWKTNYLGDNAVDYRDEALEEAMQHKHYKLQYLLYLVALKRHLKLRFGFKDPYGSIGGAAYFFLRGVKAGSDRGVYFDRPDEAVIDCIDELLAKGWSVKTVEHYRKLMKNSKKGA